MLIEIAEGGEICEFFEITPCDTFLYDDYLDSNRLGPDRTPSR